MVDLVLRKRPPPGTITHGHTRVGSPRNTYWIWAAMLDRCKNPNNKTFAYYGGRGIAVCERWLSFENFLSDMGQRPSPQHSLDRRDNSLGYSKDNCRWSTKREQMANMRSNIRVEFCGAILTLGQIAHATGVNYYSLHYRVKKRGMSAQDAVTELLK